MTQAAPRRSIGSGSSFERDIGYSRAVVESGWVFVSGTTGVDYATMTIADDALAQAGASLRDVVRVRYILARQEDFEPCWPVLRDAFGAAPPAATMMVAGLADPRMRIEIEVTARVPQ